MGPFTPAAENRGRQGAGISTNFIIFGCFGHRLPGETGAVGRRRNSFGAPVARFSAALVEAVQMTWAQPPYLLDQPRRQIVLEAIQRVCTHNGQNLLAGHVTEARDTSGRMSR